MKEKVVHASDVKPDFIKVKKAWSKLLSEYYDNYGDECQEIFFTIKGKSKEDNILIISEYRFCVRNEMCHNLLDFFSQRNSMVYFKVDGVFPFIKKNENEMKKIADISDQKWKNQLDDLKKYINEITTFN